MFVFVGGESHNNSLITIHSGETLACKEVVNITDKEMWNLANGILEMFLRKRRVTNGEIRLCVMHKAVYWLAICSASDGGAVTLW